MSSTMGKEYDYSMLRNFCVVEVREKLGGALCEECETQESKFGGGWQKTLNTAVVIAMRQPAMAPFNCNFRCGRSSSNHFKMSGPGAENLNGESSDSLGDNHQPNVSIQTEWSRVEGTNYQESVEESSKLQYENMISHKLYKAFGQQIYEGAVKGYSILTDTFKVVYENGYCDDVEGNGLISYIERHRYNNGGENASPSAPVQPPRKLPRRNTNGGENGSPSAPARPPRKITRRKNNGGKNGSPSAPVQPPRKVPRRCAVENMTTTPSRNNEGRVRTRPLMMRAENAGGSTRPRPKHKDRAKSSSRKCLTRENVNQTAPREPSTQVGNQVRGTRRALRMRAINAGDITPPRQTCKGKVQNSSRRRLLYEEYKASAYVYYSPGADEDDEDSDWKE